MPDKETKTPPEYNDQEGGLDAITSFERRWVPRLLLGFVVIAPTAAVFAGNNTGAGILGAVGAAALLLTRLSDITQFSLFGLRAELRQAIGEASATIAQLKDLAISLAGPSLDEMALSGVMFQRLTFKARYENKQKIVNALRKLKIPEAKIRAAAELWNEITLKKMSNVMWQRLDAINTQVAEEFAQKRLINERPAKTEHIRDFLARHKINGEELNALLEDYDHLFQTGEVRRPDVIPSNIVS